VILSAAASLTAPIFNAGKLRAQVRIAEAQYEEALIAFQQSLLDAGNEVNAALSQIESARSKCELRTQQVEALRTAADATQQLMTYGSTTYLEVLTAQQNLLAGMISAIADLNDMAESRIALYSALGGGRDSEVGTIYDEEAKRKASKKRRAAKK
jgi:outer membrane protein TolC